MAAGLLLAQTGYQPIRTGFVFPVPGRDNLEIDAAGIEPTGEVGHCLIVEVKGRSDSQHHLLLEAGKLADKVSWANENRSVVARELGYEGRIGSVSGRFISMAKMGEISESGSREAALVMRGMSEEERQLSEGLQRLEGIEFWDFDTFKRELKAAGVSDSHVELLQFSLLPWHVDGPRDTT